MGAAGWARGEALGLEGKELPSLDVVPGVTVLPHFGRSSDERVQQLRDTAEGRTYLGIDGATGCVLVDGEWHVYGPGSVHVITTSSADVIESGGSFRLA